MKKFLTYGGLVVVILVLFALEMFKPVPVDWSPYMQRAHKTPFGSFILAETLKDLFPSVRTGQKSLYEQLAYYDYGNNNNNAEGPNPAYDEYSEGEDYGAESSEENGDEIKNLSEFEDSNRNNLEKREPISDHSVLIRMQGKSSCYVIVTNIFDPAEVDVNTLMSYVNEGNDVFIAAERFNSQMNDLFRLEIINPYFEEVFNYNDLYNNPEDTVRGKSELRFTEKSRKSLGSFKFDRHSAVCYINLREDAGNDIEVLATLSTGEPVLIRIPYGAGYFYISSTPLVYTNYNMLKNNNHRYVSASLSMLPHMPVYWDEYYKPGKEKESDSLRFISSQAPLRWAFWITLTTLAIFMIFGSKRRQRWIPEISRPKNTTVEFVNIIGSLYFQKKDFADLARKKINYFMEYLRTKYYLQPADLKENPEEKLAMKTAWSKERIQALFQTISILQKSEFVSPKELQYLHKLIEDFKKTA